MHEPTDPIENAALRIAIAAQMLAEAQAIIGTEVDRVKLRERAANIRTLRKMMGVG